MDNSPQTSKLVFIVENGRIYEQELRVDYHGGFSLVQKHKMIDSLHRRILETKNYRILEVSRRSKDSLGGELSAFHLSVKMDGQSYFVECIYQASKVFHENVQYIECLSLSPLEAKRLIQSKVETEKLSLTHFNLLGTDFPLHPETIFYDYLYIVALSQNPSLGNRVTDFDCFTDIEYNHKRQFASQARSCAIYKYLVENGLVEDAVKDYRNLLPIYHEVIVTNQNNLFKQ